MWQSLFFNKAARLRPAIKKETLAQVFFCEFCEISKNIFFTEYLWASAYLSWEFLGYHKPFRFEWVEGSWQKNG